MELAYLLSHYQGRFLRFSENVWTDDTFSRIRVGRSSPQALFGLFSVHSRSGVYPRLIPRHNRWQLLQPTRSRYVLDWSAILGEAHGEVDGTRSPLSGVSLILTCFGPYGFCHRIATPTLFGPPRLPPESYQ